MPELVVILGAEASILVFVAAMTLYARRMDVLSGRSFEQSVVTTASSRHSSSPRHRRARDLLRLIRRWGAIAAVALSDLLRRASSPRMARPSPDTRPQTVSWPVTRPRQPHTSQPKAP